MNRRSFLQALGVGGGATAAGCNWDDNRYYVPIENLVPYLAHPVQTAPGTPNYFATTVGKGPSAWPVTAVHREGRVVNVAANHFAYHETKGKVARAVPATQLFELQRHYSPDRIAAPRRHDRKTGASEEVSFEDARRMLSDAVRAARNPASGEPKSVVYLGPYASGSIVDLIQEFADEAIFWEPMGRENEAAAAKALFGDEDGNAVLPRYDLSGAEFVLSFGAAFLGDAWGGPGHEAEYAMARDANHQHSVARFAAVTPLRDQTSANADDWYACNPGSEAQVALAIAKSVAEKSGYLDTRDENGEMTPFAKIISRADIGSAAKASGLSVSDITKLASMFEKPGSVALPGGMVGASAAGTALAAATYLLNIVSRANVNGLFTNDGYPGPVHTFGDIERLLTDMKAGRVGVLLLGDLDVLHSLPNAQAFAAALELEVVDLHVALTSHPNETTAKVDLVIPVASVFEEWGDEEPVQRMRLVRQPVMKPLYAGTPMLGDLLLDTWREVDSENAPQGSWLDRLQQTWAAKLWASDDTADGADLVSDDRFAAWWQNTLRMGFHETLGGGAPFPQTRAPQLDLNGAFKGTGEYSFVIFPHPFLLDGRYANQPWAQEVPEPMTGHVWDTWVLVHPETAKELEVGDNDVLSISTGEASLEVGVEVHPCVAKGVLAMPMGGGHTRASGRYADGVGVNAVSLLQGATDEQGALVWQHAHCTATKREGKADLHSTYGVYPRTYAAGNVLTNESDSDRNFVALVPAEQWKDVADDPVDHPGELTGIHHLPVDPRLKATGQTDFYKLPDHPSYRFGLTVDTNLCTGCGACAVACYAENNLPVVGKEKVKQGREMSWIRVNRYFRENELGEADPTVHFVPMMCQHCGHAPCESVCPVLATYHSIDGLNAMVYNRCVGTRYCSNACPYSARKFNYHSYAWPEPFNLQLNPDVVTRTMGVMEKCSFCVQRIRRIKSAWRDSNPGKLVPEVHLEQLPACAEACPSNALTFGNLNDEEQVVSSSRKSARNYIPLAEVHTFPAVNYLAKASFHFEPGHHGGGHGDSHGEKHHDEASSGDHH
ncbi:MAG: 4Fe-4S dicluster domain-containing protein [Myxococcota bacterium]